MIIQPLENPAQAVYCLNIVVKLRSVSLSILLMWTTE